MESSDNSLYSEEDAWLLKAYGGYHFTADEVKCLCRRVCLLCFD